MASDSIPDCSVSTGGQESPSSPSESKSKGGKRRFDQTTINVLEEHFMKKRKISQDEKKALAEKTNLTEGQIGKWFANRRRRDKESVTQDSSVQAAQTIQQALDSASPIDGSAIQTALLSVLAFLQNSPAVAPPVNVKRHLFTDSEQECLLKAFAENQFPTAQERTDLAAKLGLSKDQVTRWFQNRRHIQCKAKKSENSGSVDV